MNCLIFEKQTLWTDILSEELSVNFNKIALAHSLFELNQIMDTEEIHLVILLEFNEIFFPQIEIILEKQFFRPFLFVFSSEYSFNQKFKDMERFMGFFNCLTDFQKMIQKIKLISQVAG